ncbi:group I intron endonuclease [Caballeronia udeis]|uniref:Group I intron endonuclease n=1 Tax=Caballeronia udeis TaxID=1232866 RepID=A0ABW8MLR5_9BURK
MASGVYKIINSVTGECYIGSTRSMRGRMAEHKYKLRCGKHNAMLQRAWDYFGEEVFEFVLIESCPLDSLKEREQFWMDTLRPAYNISPNSKDQTGTKHSIETRKLVSESLRGNKRTLGFKHRPETRERMSSRLMGVKKTDEHLAKLRAGYAAYRARLNLSKGIGNVGMD